MQHCSITYSPWFTLVHTNAASLLPSITPGTQGPTHLLGRQSKHESCMMRCSPWFRFSQNNQPNLELTSSPLSSSFPRTISEKKYEIPCHHPPLNQIETSLTLNHTSPFPQASPGGPWTRYFSIPLVPIKHKQDSMIGNCYPANCTIAHHFLANCATGNRYHANCSKINYYPANCTKANSYPANYTIKYSYLATLQIAR